LHRLTSAFILGYHGCDQGVGERLLAGTAFAPSNNDYDWLGPGIYFWEANPLRGLEFAEEASKRRTSSIKRPFVIGAVIELGLCLDLTTSSAIEHQRRIAAEPRLCRCATSAHDSRNAEVTGDRYGEGRFHGGGASVSGCGISGEDSYTDRGLEPSMY
jgi:hypothetical protein